MAAPLGLSNEVNYTVSIISKKTVSSNISRYSKYNSCAIYTNAFIYWIELRKSNSDFTLNVAFLPRKKKEHVPVIQEKHLIVDITFDSNEEIKYLWQL